MGAMSSRNPWSLAAGLILAAAAILTASHWPIFPFFLDSYYHLSVIRGFQQAGGPVLHAFWEAAPQGRPHLYPPLFHLIFLPASLGGVPFIQLARFWTWASFPLLLAVTWAVLIRVASPRLACLALILLATPYSFFLGTINHAPATLALVAGLGMMLALHRKRWLAGGLCLAAAFWLHAGLPWLLALSVLLFGLLEREYRKSCLSILAVALLAASPWLLHLWNHHSLVQLQPRGEEQMLEAPVPLLLLGLWGWVVAWRRKGMLRYLAVMAVAFLAMALAGYRSRFLATQGLFPWLLLAAVALDGLKGKLVMKLLLGLLLLSPSLHLSDGRMRLAWVDTTFPTLVGLVPARPRGTANTVYNEKFMGELTEAVRSHTRPDELIYSNVNYLAGMMTAFTGRAATNQMLREMADRPAREQIPQARLVIWVKELSGERSREMEGAVVEHHLRPLAETEIAYLFLNLRPAGRRHVTPALFPWWVASCSMLLAAAVAAWDLSRPS
jgi:hypothetical protein